MASKKLIGNSLPCSVSLFDLVLGSLKQGADWETVSQREGNILSPSCAIHAALVPQSWISKQERSKPSLSRPALYEWFECDVPVYFMHAGPVLQVSCAQWAVGGLSARQKGLASEWGKSQPSWWFFQGVSPSLLECQVCTKAMPFNVESEGLGHTISFPLHVSWDPWKEDKCSCHVKDKHCDICEQ